MTVTTDLEAAFAESGKTPTVVLVLKTTESAIGDTGLYAKIAARTEPGRNLLIGAVQLTKDGLALRAVGCAGRHFSRPPPTRSPARRQPDSSLSPVDGPMRSLWKLVAP